jgi:hypothetical protein
MGVGVDKTRADHLAPGIELPAPSINPAADFDDDTAVDGYVGLPFWAARSINDHAISDYQVMHLLAVPSFDHVARDRLPATAPSSNQMMSS